MTITALLAWWNLIYVVPFGLAITYLALYVFTGITFGDTDADVDAGGIEGGMDSGHVHVEAHVVEPDAHMEAHADADADHDADTNNTGSLAIAGAVHTVPHSVDAGADHASLVHNILSLLGVGRIPLSLALMILLLLWGAVGFMLNQLLAGMVSPQWIIGFISIPLTATISLTLTGLAARVIGKFLPTMETYAHRRGDLVGQAGEAIYDINDTFGLASVRDPSGDLFQVYCRTAGDKPPIPKGTRVVLFDYDREKGVFHVAPLAA